MTAPRSSPVIVEPDAAKVMAEIDAWIASIGRITPAIRQRILDAVDRYDRCKDSRPLVHTLHHDDPLTVGDLRSIAIALRDHGPAQAPVTPSVLVKRPVAFRVVRPDSNPGFSLFHDEELAASEAELCDGEYQALFVRDGTAIVAEWEPIETAPKDGSFLVCAIGDDRGPFVVNGQILAMARKANTPSHLGLSYVTHWQPLPAGPSVSSTQQGGK